MPVIQIKALPQKPTLKISEILKKLCVEVADFMEIPHHKVWANWETIEHYTEGNSLAVTQPAATHPPIVQLILFEGRSIELTEQIMEKIAAVLIRELTLEAGNIYLFYTEAKAGKLYTGGSIRRNL